MENTTLSRNGTSGLLVPSFLEVRGRIEHAGDHEFKLCLMTALELCARISEIVGVSTPGDGSFARGPRGSDAKDDWWGEGFSRQKALVIDVRTAKRKGLVRRIGLPPDFDPWVMKVAEHFWSRGDGLAFPFTRHSISEYVNENALFEGWGWPVQDYSIYEGKGIPPQKIEGHIKPFSLHSLRDVRATQLLTFYGFDGVDLAIHGGWTIQNTVAGVTSVMARYLDIYQDWRRPFPKLMKNL